MFFKNLKYIRLLFAFSLLILLFSCKKNNNELKKIITIPVYHCKIFTSSNSPIENLLNPKTWNSSIIGQDDIIIFAFDTLIYVDKIEIKQLEFKNSDKILKIGVYTNNGFVGEFIPEKIKIKQKLGFLILRIIETRDFQLTNFYKNLVNYKIAFPVLNKISSVKNIDFFSNDSVKIILRIDNEKENLERKIINFPSKIVDYTDYPKSIVIKPSGEVFGFSTNFHTDTIYHGYLNEQKKLSISKLIFSKNKFHAQRVNSNYSMKNNILSISFLPKFRTDFDNDYFVEVKSLDNTIVEDIRYATTNNFTGKIIYDCPKCLMRYGAAKDLVKAEKEFLTMGLRIKVFDCYRPHSAQYKLWEIMPNKNYVANPDMGSIHNRGVAVDMTLVDSLGNELDMGTDFDFFGTKAFSIYTDLSAEVIQNRNLMWNVMHKYGFKEIKTEWWHLSHYSCMRYPISDEPLPCN